MPGLHKLCQPGSLAVRKWRENENEEEMEREDEEMERMNENREGTLRGEAQT